MSRHIGEDGLIDFGMKQATHEGVILEARALFPDLTLGDLSSIYEKAYKATPPGDCLAGNPSKWPSSRAMMAVVKAIHASLAREI